MKKILDSNLFAILLVVLQVICVIIAIQVAVNDGCHTWIAFLFFTLIGLFLVSVILMICALVVKSTKRWLYIVLTIFWLLSISPMLEDIFYAQYMESELEDLEFEMQEYKESEIEEDSIYYIDSIRNANDSL